MCLSYACRAQHYTYFVLVVNSRNKMWGNLFMCFKLETHLTFKRLFIARAHISRETIRRIRFFFLLLLLRFHFSNTHAINITICGGWCGLSANSRLRYVVVWFVSVCVCVRMSLKSDRKRFFCPLILLFRVKNNKKNIWIFVFGRCCCLCWY